jgi:hypothetical protein
VGAQAAGAGDNFVARFKADSTLSWARRAGGQGSHSGTAIAATPDGTGLQVTGFYGNPPLTGELAPGIVTFGAGEPTATTFSNLGPDVFVARYQVDGRFAWARHASGYGANYGQSIGATSDGGAVVAGGFGGPSYRSNGFEPTTFGTASDAEQITLQPISFQVTLFVARYDANGALVWARELGSSGTYDDAYGLAIGADDSATVVGRFDGTGVFDAVQAGVLLIDSYGNLDAYLARFGP